MNPFQRLIIGILISVLLPVAAQACTVCFGGEDVNLREGFFWGIVVLGSLPFILIGSFVGTIIWNHKKRKSQRDASS